MHVSKTWVLLGAIALSACQAANFGAADAKRTPAKAAKTPAATASPGATAAAAKAALFKARREAIVAALNNMLAASQASTLTGAMSQASGVVSNAGASVISNNGAGIISNNGGGIVSDNGLGYRALAVPTEVVTETDGLVYVIRPESKTKGEFKTYDKAGYKTLPLADREQALVDHFTWDDVTFTPGVGGDPLKVSVAYHLQKVTSKRLFFANRVISRPIYKISLDPSAAKKQTQVGCEFEFDVEVALVGNTKDKASFKFVAGEKDLFSVPTSNGFEMAFAKRMDVTGTNSTGSYAGEWTGTDDFKNVVTHTSTSGVKTAQGLDVTTAGAVTRTIDLPANQLRLVLKLDAESHGSGELLDTATKTPTAIGTVTWTEAGIGTVTPKDGEPFEVRIF